MTDVDKIFARQLRDNIYFLGDRPDLLIRVGSEKQRKWALSIYLAHARSVCQQEGMWDVAFFGKNSDNTIFRDRLANLFLFDYFTEKRASVWIERRGTNLHEEFKKWKKEIAAMTEESEDAKHDADTNEKCA